MKLVTACESDLDKIRAFYDYVIDFSPNMEKYVKWKKGLHPTDEGLKSYTENGIMYLLTENEDIIAAMAVTDSQGEEYHAIDWKTDCADNEVCVLHILAVHPSYQKKGIAKIMVNEAFSIACSKGKKALRLDAIKSNAPAQRLYASLGFDFMGEMKMMTLNAGLAEFYCYEKTTGEE